MTDRGLVSSFLTIKSGEKRNSGRTCRLLSKTYKMKKPTLLGRCSTVDVFPLLDGYETIPAPTAEYMTSLFVTGMVIGLEKTGFGEIPSHITGALYRVLLSVFMPKRPENKNIQNGP